MLTFKYFLRYGTFPVLSLIKLYQQYIGSLTIIVSYCGDKVQLLGFILLLNSNKSKKMSTSNTPTILQSTFLGGAAAVFAVNFTHPIELVKSRVQISNLGVMQTFSDTLKNEGFAAFWKVRIKLAMLLSPPPLSLSINPYTIRYTIS